MPSVTGKSGGVVIYYKEELAIEKLDLDFQNFTSHSEIIAVKARKFATIFILIYRHPNDKAALFVNDLHKITSLFILQYYFFGCYQY